ncbi:hypothetical protein BH09PLA1_BH09PLA1_30200 [soil metagenome]
MQAAQHTIDATPRQDFATALPYDSFMPLQCNIDAKGKRVRLINGIVTTIFGIVLLFWWAMPARSSIGWTIAIASIVGGAFMIFEARAGWCVIRAMGFKTPI